MDGIGNRQKKVHEKQYTSTKRPRDAMRASQQDEMDAEPIKRSSFATRQPLLQSSTPASDSVLLDPDVSSDDAEYCMGHLERGLALIFNHEFFDPETKYTRTVRSKDKYKFHTAFTSLGFNVLSFNDLSFNAIQNELRQVAGEDHRNRDCIAVAVLTHGGKGGTLAARDCNYLVNELWEPFTANNCITLAGKPKLFFIKTYKGQEKDYGGIVAKISRDVPDMFRIEQPVVPVPTHADILVSYATSEGQVSFGNENDGSWYVQTLCKELQDYGTTKDLLSLLIDVNRIFYQKFLSVPMRNKVHGMVQMPLLFSTLTGRLCFSRSVNTHRQSSLPQKCP